MSGSSSITIKSDYFLLHAQTPSISFVETRDEREFHTRWKKESEPVMEKAKVSIEHFVQQHRLSGLVKYDSLFVQYFDHDTEGLEQRNAKCEAACIAFSLPMKVNMAMTHLNLCFSLVPAAEDRNVWRDELLRALAKDSLINE